MRRHFCIFNENLSDFSYFRQFELVFSTAILSLTFAHSALAQTSSPVAADPTSDLFRTICVSSGAKYDQALTLAKKAGFEVSKVDVPVPQGMTKATALERVNGKFKTVAVMSLGSSAISKSFVASVPVQACAITETSGEWNALQFARDWVGIAPQIETANLAAYQYFERPSGNVQTSDDDLAGLIAGTNRGEVRVLAARHEGGMRALSWVVFAAPSPPISNPAELSTLHDIQPFAPCRWATESKRKGAETQLSCPDFSGKFKSTFSKGVTEATPVLARSGDVSAMLKMSTFYSNGPDQVRDLPSAFSWSLRAAEAGSPGGALNVGLAYEVGLGVIADNAQAQRWYQIATDRNHAPAMLNLAALLLYRPNVQSPEESAYAVSLVQKAVDAGSAVAAFNMGILFETGVGKPKDMTEAVRWFNIAAERKDTLAMSRIGLIYADGIGGVAQDQAEAVRWLVKGSESALRLASIFNNVQAMIYGFNNPQTREKYRQAAQTDPRLASSLGLYLADRTNPDRNPVEALRLLRIAAAARIPFAAVRIGMMFAEGDGTTADNIEAIKWLRSDQRLQKAVAFQRTTEFTDKTLP